MSEFIQIHLLVSYPPSNLNRDDLGRPKTAIMGGKTRLRISSQSLKRAWRTSDIFSSAVSGHIGIRTKDLGKYIKKSYETGMKLSDILSGNEVAKPIFTGTNEKTASAWAKILTEQTGKLKGADSFSIEQLTHFDPSEISVLERIIEDTATSEKEPGKEDADIFLKKLSGVDIAMFGRMLASSPKYNIEAAVQVAHAITVNQVVIEDDFFTAVDDLNRGEE
ncbi:MAG: type I-E CRISPR-associated protein Cas7/Cse4/CasC, partial [Methanomicrobiales archaeon]|nr:type I-E CRISPR-associated protein Cas7/Cse4/CasC [Methanomicrobiales archaeon]